MIASLSATKNVMIEALTTFAQRGTLGLMIPREAAYASSALRASFPFFSRPTDAPLANFVDELDVGTVLLRSVVVGAGAVVVLFGLGDQGDFEPTVLTDLLG